MSRNLELLIAFVVVALLTAVYLPLATPAAPQPGSLVGHSVGIIGFVLMLATETLYSLRKRSSRMAWGRLQTWLSLHIIMGIVGPYMVFLHTAFRFAGLAGATLVLALVVVFSGFVGRYIYTAIPRTAAGAEMKAVQLETALRQLESQLAEWAANQPAPLREMVAQISEPSLEVGGGARGLVARMIGDWRERRRWQRQVRQLNRSSRKQATKLRNLVRRWQVLRRQLATMASARRLLALWHAAHIPIGLVMFAMAFLHIAATLYYR